jgi:uncharacterized protein (DUF1330 family)
MGTTKPVPDRQEDIVTAYAIAHLRTPHINAEVLDYIERIQETMDPFRGRFLVHGAEVEVREGSWPGTIVVIGFPSMNEARTWYDSPAYQAILPLRTANIEGETILVDGIGPAYDASGTAQRLRAGTTE